jgi:hypothetical protein
MTAMVIGLQGALAANLEDSPRPVMSSPAIRQASAVFLT